MPFIGDLVIKQLPVKVVKRNVFGIFSYRREVIEWEIFKSFIYQNDILNIRLMVPKGARTDFASIPRPFWPILPPVGRYSKAVVVHDYCYRNGLFDRQMADLLFFYAMKELNVVKWKRFTMYAVVRAFGSNSYKEASK